MKYYALFDFVHNMIKIKGGKEFDNKEIGFSDFDINFLRSQNKIVPIKIHRKIGPVEDVIEENIEVEDIPEEIKEEIVEEKIESNESEELNSPEEYPEFENMTKEDIDKWAEQHNINLDRRFSKDKMINILFEELNK